MILKHRDKELLRFDWIGDVRVRIVSVNDAERQFLPLEFGTERLDCSEDALRYPLEDWLVSRSAPVGRHFMRNLMESLGLNIKKHRHYNWSDERRIALSEFLQKRISDIRRFGREADKKSEQSLVAESLIYSENVGVRSASDSGLSPSEQRAAMLILRNSSVTEAEIANQLGMTVRQVERIVASLKAKAGLQRRGTDKAGEWCFP